MNATVTTASEAATMYRAIGTSPSVRTLMEMR